MIFVRLRQAIQKYESMTGSRMTYEHLAQCTGLSRATLESLASRQNYNPRLSTIDKLCSALNCTPSDILEYHLEGQGRANED